MYNIIKFFECLHGETITQMATEKKTNLGIFTYL